MAITNVCPYCGGEMRCGALPAVRDGIFWYPYGEDGKLENEWGSESGVRLGRGATLFGRSTPAYCCEDCGVVIVPVPSEDELKSGFMKAVEKLGDSIDDRLSEREARAAARAEEKAREQREKERKRRGEKDPWEV